MATFFTIDNLPWIITTAIAIVAFLSPIITTIINNLHDSKIKKLEFENELRKENVKYRIDELQKYLWATSLVVGDQSGLVDLSDYFPSYAKATTLINDEELLKMMRNLNRMIMEGEQSDQFELFEKILPKIKVCINQPPK